MAKRKSIGQAELEVLKYIAANDSVAVRQVADHFAATKGYVRPTVLKMMERLREKGYLERETVEGLFMYRSVVGQDELGQTLIGDFVEGALNGSVTPMVAYLVKKGSMSAGDVDQLRKLIEELDAKEKGK
jgi:predicted transcriptional regulator